MTVDETLAEGWYMDRRGKGWERKPSDWWWYQFPSGRRLTRDQMRLLIKRDQHRDECHRRGASNCIDHPVPIVYWNDREDAWMARPAGGWPPHEDVPLYFDLPEAMDAARALAVGE